MNKMHRFEYQAPATVAFTVYAETREKADQAAEAWQDHASGCDYFSEVESIGDSFDQIDGAVVQGSALLFVDTTAPPTFQSEQPDDVLDAVQS